MPSRQIHACISQGVSRDEFTFLAHAIFLVRSSVASRSGDMQAWHNLRFDGGCPADYSGDSRAGIEMRSFIEKRRPPCALRGRPDFLLSFASIMSSRSLRHLAFVVDWHFASDEPSCRARGGFGGGKFAAHPQGDSIEYKRTISSEFSAGTVTFASLHVASHLELNHALCENLLHKEKSLCQ